MLNLIKDSIKDYLYKFGFLNNELCDYVLQSPENINLFLRDARYTKYEFVKPKSSPDFEKNLEDLLNNNMI